MKKLMTSVIILLPLIILLILLVSGAIIGFLTHIYVESVEFVDADTLVLQLKDETQPPQHRLKVNVLPLEADNRSLNFTVDDSDIVEVSEDGTVTARYFGETFVTVASSENKAAFARRKVIVTDSSVHALRFNEFADDMYRGETQRLSVRVIPHEAANTLVHFTSSNSDVLTVSADGEVVCHGAGVATITAISDDNPSVTDEIIVHCHEPLVNIGVQVSSVVTAELTSRFPALTVYPADATYSVAYTVSDGSIASVDESGLITFAKAGFVTVTATATDDRDHSASVSVNYTCTYGYYLGNLFDKTEYSFDYDRYKGGVLSDIVLRESPDGAYRQIMDVSFRGSAGLISFDDKDNTFTLNDVGDDLPLGRVEIVIHAKKFDTVTNELKEFTTDVCYVTVTRQSRSVAFAGKDGDEISAATVSGNVNVLELLQGNIAPSGLGVLVTPRNHTDKLVYKLDSPDGKASLHGTEVRFVDETTATLTVGVTEGDEFVVSAQVNITYIAPTDSKLSVTVDKEHPAPEITLEIHGNDTKTSAVLDMETPAGYKTVITADKPEVVDIENDNGVWLFEPLQGGFVTVTISFVRASELMTLALEEEASSYSITIYVDGPIFTDDFEFVVGDDIENFTTSKETLPLSVRFNGATGSMEGKELFINGVKAQQDQLVYVTSPVQFGAENSVNVRVSVRYDERAGQYNGKGGEEILACELTVRSTHGALSEAPVVSYGDGADAILVQGKDNVFNFADKGATLTFTVRTAGLKPRDIVLGVDDVVFASNRTFTYAVDVRADSIVITLTSRDSGTEITSLTIAGQAFAIRIESSLLANKIEVAYDGDKLAAGTDYITFWDSLTFAVTIGRADGMSPSDKVVKYKINDGVWTTVSDPAETVYVDISIGSDTSSITFAVGANESVSVTVKLRKVDYAALDYSYTARYTVGQADKQLGAVTLDDGEDMPVYNYVFPYTMDNSFIIDVKFPAVEGVRLGGFTQAQFTELFKVDEIEGWSVRYDLGRDSGTVTVTLPTGDAAYVTNAAVTFRCGSRAAKLVLSRINIKNIEFVGFDSTVSTHNYRGFQQVRVFAKHSYYKGVQVDYFRIPFNALGGSKGESVNDLSKLTFTLSRYEGETLVSDGAVTVCGTRVECGNAVYEIYQCGDGSYGLKDSLGNIVVENGVYKTVGIPWIDVYTEKDQGYARLYFGNFAGLTESDVRNDYFGNFGEERGWSRVPDNADDYDGSGRTFRASDNAYSYLRLEASDGFENTEVTTHFNFNVLDDDTVVNVFDSQGYLNNKKIVLHNNLYGAGEVPKVTTPGVEYNADQFLDETYNFTSSNWGSSDKVKYEKDLIYGNGCQVNLKAVNDGINTDSTGTTDGMLNNGKENTAYAINFGRFYNLTMKGTTAANEITCITNRIYFGISGIYYSTVQSYSKIGTGVYTFVKNSVLRYAANCALQIWGATQTSPKNVYLENAVIAECLRAISVESSNPYVKTYLKGSFDVLNYYNSKGMQNAYSNINTGVLDYYTMFIEDNLTQSAAKSVLEWFGKDGSQGTQEYRYYANMGIVIDPFSTCTLNYWDETKQTYSTYIANNPLQLTSKTVGTDSLMSPKIMIYNPAYYGKDGGDMSTLTDRNMSELFNPQRKIRLLCEYKTINGTELVKNTSHIMWHMQEAYRNTDLIDGRKDHITDLKESLEGVTWPDGSGVRNGEAVEVAAAANALASHTILPERKEYGC